MKIEIINSTKFKNISDVIFSETTDYEDFLNKNNNKDLHTIEEKSLNGSRFVTYISKSLSVSNGDIIFCQTDYLKYLFELLNGSGLNKIDLITHQSDITITKKLYDQKPDCINYWYSTNVSIEDEKLIPIPIGINNHYYQTFPIEEDFVSKQFNEYKEKEKKFYLNFNVNTNFYHRLKVLKKYSYQSNSIISTRTNKKEYLEDLNKNKFIICPFGNGIDTHRIWESIYTNSYPVVEMNVAFKDFQNLPIIFVENLAKDDINLENLKNVNLEMADFYYWKNMILSNKNKFQNVDGNYLTLDLNKFLTEEKTYRQRNSRNKKIKYLIFRVYKYIYLFIFRKVVI